MLMTAVLHCIEHAVHMVLLLLGVDASAVQIYNDQADDLLDDSRQNVSVQSAGATSLTWQRCDAPHDLTALVHRARQSLVYAETRMNKASSRSHAIFQLRIRRRISSEDRVTGTCSLLRIVDLAGSERTKKSQVEGLRLKETNAINRSLLALGNVVNALAFRKQHVPIRDSKLTLMLSDSLGGNCKTAMLVCVGPCASHAAETLSSLEFASRAMHIEVHACVNVLPSAPAEPWVEGYVRGLSEQAEGFRLAAAQGAERAAKAEEALGEAERRRSEVESRTNLV
ncbi:KIF4B [Symbiodinium natans]|uniref:KIF4B protein n=1 Tax=Symbiodinium natans TaxID=878477 RepID=A0A812NGT4_9DINO|nr:KIF4B [Symbiodinium natans]